MSFQTIKTEQPQAVYTLQNALQNKKVSHAYIFHGPPGTGKKNTALALAKAIFCLRSDMEGCGQCVECRKVEHGNHPDLYMLEPDGTAVKIEQIRGLQREFAYRSAQSQTKIYMILHAERMTVQAANSLLKFLEEPNSNVVSILITENGHALLPTIRSRAQWVPFTPVAPQALASKLLEEGHSPSLVYPAVHMAAGMEGARQFIQSNWFAELLNVVIQLAKEVFVNLSSAMMMAHHKVVKTELIDHIDKLMDLFILLFKDMIQVQWNRKDSIVFKNQADWIAKTAFARDSAFWIRNMERAAENQKRLRFHANSQLALEQFLIGMEGR